MSTNKFEHLRNVAKGRTDWKIKVRIIRQWRGKTATGEPFSNYNILLLDAKNCRMEATVPTYLTHKISRILELGKMYIITNFQVLDYTAKDKWRPVNMDRHIKFTNLTKAREIPEKEYFIPHNVFDFFAFEALENLAMQNLLLPDVIRVVVDRQNLQSKHTSMGREQVQVKLKISDGRKKINVTFWDTAAYEFQNRIDTCDFEYPLIIIIASGKVSKFRDELDICNYSPTTFYINYNHHSVAELRKMVPNFPKQEERRKTRKRLEVFTVEQITGLPADYINEKVVCQVTINKVDEIPTWYYCICTSCYLQVDLVEGNYTCNNCKRIVPEPDKKFGICVTASDKTGDIGILLMDRPVRTLFNKTVFDLDKEYNGAFPTIMKKLENGDYTIKLMISKENIGNKEEYYLATDIFSGFDFDQTVAEEETILKLSQHSIEEPSGTSYHLDNISQLNDGN